MKERIMKIVKIFLIILGALFLVQIILGIIAIITWNSYSKIDISTLNMDKKSYKQIQPIVSYAQNYYNKNSKYPKTLENVKINKKLNYEYKTYENDDCFSIKFQSNKENTKKEYQRCSHKYDDTNSYSEQYLEMSN